MDPERYGHPNTASEIEPERDLVEFDLLKLAIEHDIPTLGICRGHQILNVLAGGTLIQDDPGHAVYNRHGSSEVHHLRLSPDSRISAIYGGTASVNSLHHQKVDEIGSGLTPTAWSEDGTVEALEMDGKDIVTVQWHPEMLDHHQPIFDWLVRTARERMTA